MVNLVPQDAPHPLYGDPALRDAFLRDTFVPLKVGWNRPHGRYSPGHLCFFHDRLGPTLKEPFLQDTFVSST